MNRFKYPLVIHNPLAAGGRAGGLLKKYQKKFAEKDLFKKTDVYESFSKQNTIDKIISIHKDKKNKYDLLISVGGDGSISTVCNGLMRVPLKKRLPLFPLPTGSGNSFLRDFGINSIDDSIRNYMNEKPKMVDALLAEEINGKFKWYCFNVLGLGFISDIADYVVKNGKQLGAFSYVLGTVLALGRFRPYKTTVIYNNGRSKFHSDRVFFMTVSNTKYTGGKIMIAPDARYDDGMMDVVILHDINRFKFLNGFRKTSDGKHINDKGCFYFKTKDIEIRSEPGFFLMPDGELEGRSPVKVKVIPKQIKFIV